MKLIGSKTESDFRVELLRSNHALQASDSKLRKALETEGHDTKNAYILRSTPDELEVLYTVLIDGSYLISVVIENYENSMPPILERSELETYLQGLRKIDRVQLLVAQYLARTKT